ncbi:MAG: hypothetical protein KDC79_08210 [Cyclobacteriaceae bacterium]|nr:hypothetical protein [Cyclobacteriaceae bacterium]
MKKFYFLGVGLLFSLAIANAQTINNVQASLSGNTVIISYDLVASDNDQVFNVAIKSSKDNFVSSLIEVTGDVGPNQKAGVGKKIIWDAKKELGKFNGEISFEITAEVTFTPLKFVKPTAGAGLKIGKPYSIQWKGGTSDNQLKLELLKNNTSVMDMGTINNNGRYSWNVPKTMEKGGNYQFRLMDPSKPNDALLSGSFNLKKTSILVYVIPGVVAVGALTAVLVSGGGGGETPSGDTELPDPPSPPAGN